jgi:NAD+ kinase
VKIAVFMRKQGEETAEAVGFLRREAEQRGHELVFGDRDENGDVPHDPDTKICLVLGGDGTILHALREYAGTDIPIFGVNFGEVGFLAAVDREEALDGIRRALDGDFECLKLPAIELDGTASAPGRTWTAINDISLHRKQGLRVADLAYTVGADEVGRVRADGLVVATPAGSTGYNLANGGPVMAWGVEGFVVSFIAPHSLTARTLVVAPQDAITVRNVSREDPVDVTVDGRPVCHLDPGEGVEATFRDDVATLAQIPGATFYHRLRQKFGRLATGV